MISKEERAVLDAVSIEEPWALVEAFSTQVREHPDAVNRAMDHVAGRLRGFGIEVAMHEPKLHLSLPGPGRVEAGGRSFDAKPPAYSADARGGVAGELVYVPAGQAKDIDSLFIEPGSFGAAAKAHGKIVISEGFALPGLMSELERLGAAGVIAVNPGARAHAGICTSIWGTPDLDDLPRKPKIPAVAVNNLDGRALIELARQGARVSIYTEMQEGWFVSKIPVVEIRGAREPEAFVLLHGHLDSWDVGVGDNAVGNAAMLEIARVLHAHRDKLARSVRIAWWPGHSTGRYAGSTWYADAFAMDLDRNCVAQVNCDSPGCRCASEFTELAVMSEAAAFLSEAIADVAGKTAVPERPPRAGDYSFNNIGISSYLMLSSTMPAKQRAEMGYYAVGGCGGNIAWHTVDDRLEIADRDNLLRDIKLYLLAVLRTANARILPFDWRSTAREFLETIDSYQAAAGALADLSPSKQAASRLNAALEVFHAGVEQGGVAPAAANRAIMDLARILVPINYAREARFRHDPALSVPPLPTLSVTKELASHGETTRGFALTQLTRGQNRLVAALEEATRLVQAAATGRKS